MVSFVTRFHFSTHEACLASQGSNLPLGMYKCGQPVTPIPQYGSVRKVANAKLPWRCHAIRAPVAPRGVLSETVQGHDGGMYGDGRDLQQASTAVEPLSRFCTTMVDTVVVGNQKHPAVQSNYSLCVDTAKRHWHRIDPRFGELIFNGTNLITISRMGRLAGHCSVGLPEAPPNPAITMPFSMLRVDQGAEKTATTNGLTVWQHKRPATGAEPAETMYWFVNAAEQLVRSKCVTGVQHGVPNATVGTHDYFAAHNFTAEIPAGTFEVPARCH